MSSTSIFRSTLVYWSGRMLARATTVLVLPLITRHIDPASWGALALLMVAGDLAALAVLCQLPVALFRAWAAAPGEAERRRLAGAVLIAPLVLAAGLFVPVYLAADAAAAALGIAGYGDELRLLLVVHVFNVLQMVLMAEVRLRDETRRYAVLELLQNVGQALLSIAFVAGLGLGIRGMIYAQLAGVLVTFLYLLPRFLRRARLNLDLRVLRPLFVFALPLLPSALAMAGVHNIDRFILQALRGPAELGVYAVGYKLGFAINVMLVAPFLLVWEPKSFQIARTPDAAQRFGRVATWFIAAAAFVLAGVVGARDEIVRVLAAPEYRAARDIVPLIAASYVLFGVDAIARVGLLAAGRSRTVLGVVLVALGVKAGASYLLVPSLGMSGAALATLAAFGVLLVLDLFLSQRHLPIAWETGRITAALGLAALTAAGMVLVDGGSLLRDIALKGAVLAVYPLLLLAGGFHRTGPAAAVRKGVGADTPVASGPPR